MQYCALVYHRGYIYILSLSRAEFWCFLSSFVASIIVESPVQRMGWSEVLYPLALVVILCEVLEAACCCWRQSPFPFLANCSTEPPAFWKRLIICHCCLSHRIIMSFGLFLSSLGESSFKETSSIILSFLPYATTFYSHQLYKVCGTKVWEIFSVSCPLEIFMHEFWKVGHSSNVITV